MIGMTGGKKEIKLKQTLSCSPMYKFITLSQMNTIQSSMPQLIELFWKNGEIKENEYDELKIMGGGEEGQGGSKNHIEKDERVIIRQRAVGLTSLETIKRRNDYVREKKIKMEEGEKRRKEKGEEKENKKVQNVMKETAKKRKLEDKAEEKKKRVKMEEAEAQKMMRVSSLRGREGEGKKKENNKGKGGGGAKKK